ncbi:MAG: hypothetical protein ACYDGN_14705 [Acidimicrobiales bacterium]
MSTDEEAAIALEAGLRAVCEAVGLDPSVLGELLQEDRDGTPSIVELRRFAMRLWRYFLRTGPPALEGDGSHVRLVAWAWAAQAFRHTRMAFHLERNGFGDGVAAHARSAIEHGVYLSLLAELQDQGAFLDGLEATYRRQGRRILTAAIEEGEKVPPALALFMDALGFDPGGSSRSEAFEQVCSRLTSGDRVYLHYRYLSSLVHAGFGSAAPFMLRAVSGGLEEPRLAHVPLVADLRRQLWPAIGGSCWAAWAVDQLLGSACFSGSLDATARAFDFMPLKLKE